MILLFKLNIICWKKKAKLQENMYYLMLDSEYRVIGIIVILKNS